MTAPATPPTCKVPSSFNHHLERWLKFQSSAIAYITFVKNKDYNLSFSEEKGLLLQTVSKTINVVFKEVKSESWQPGGV